MKTRFFCPHCQAMLNPVADIVLVARFGGVVGLMCFNPEPGVYRFHGDEKLAGRLAQGDEVEFSCPVCRADLAARSADKLVEIGFVTPDEKVRVARFSRVCGEHATFVSDGETVDAYGEHIDRYRGIDFMDFDWRW
jgi:hypothetical protein